MRFRPGAPAFALPSYGLAGHFRASGSEGIADPTDRESASLGGASPLSPNNFRESKPQQTGTGLLIRHGEVATTSGSTNSLPRGVAELKQLREAIVMFSQARRELKTLPDRKRPLDSVFSDRPPSVEEMLRRYDTNHDGKPSATELARLAAELRNN